MRGERSPDDIRKFFTLFETTHPDMIAFAEEWATRMPHSAFANTAHTWSLMNASWITRGEGLASQTHPDALRKFSQLRRSAAHHATIAYKNDPDLLAAAEAMISLGHNAVDKRVSYLALRRVMNSHPNWGTLRRALYLSAPGWGGRLQEADWMCETYAPMLKDEIGIKVDPVLYCQLYAAVQYHDSSRGDWAREQIWSIPLHSLTKYTLNYATWHTATREQAQIAHDYLIQPHVTHEKYAYEFDSRMHRLYGFDFLYEGVLRRAQANALKKLEHDPFNPDLLDILQKWISRYELNEEGQYSFRTVERLSYEKEVDYARRRLIIQPHIPSHWKNYARKKFGPLNAKGIAKSDPYQINAIFYSGNAMRQVAAFLYKKHWEYWVLIEAKPDEVPDEWKNALAQTDADLDHDIICPIVRAYRVVDHLCETGDYVKGPEAFCGMDIAERANYNRVLADASRRSICEWEFTTPPEELLYTPVAVDLNEAEF
ncbi:MAG: hypothetical protein AB8B82_08005 [Roseovarius sp.]